MMLLHFRSVRLRSLRVMINIEVRDKRHRRHTTHKRGFSTKQNHIYLLKGHVARMPFGLMANEL